MKECFSFSTYLLYVIYVQGKRWSLVMQTITNSIYNFLVENVFCSNFKLIIDECYKSDYLDISKLNILKKHKANSCYF